jgi:hypothetical protein
MKVVLTLAVVSMVLIVVLPKLQSYMRMLIEEHDEMEKLS